MRENFLGKIRTPFKKTAQKGWAIVYFPTVREFLVFFLKIVLWTQKWGLKEEHVVCAVKKYWRRPQKTKQILQILNFRSTPLQNNRMNACSGARADWPVFNVSFQRSFDLSFFFSTFIPKLVAFHPCFVLLPSCCLLVHYIHTPDCPIALILYAVSVSLKTGTARSDDSCSWLQFQVVWTVF